MMRKWILTYLFVWICGGALGAPQSVIHICNRQDFDLLQEKLEKAVFSGSEDISVVFAPGDYFFRHNHIKIYGKDWKNVRLTMSGNGARLLAEGPDLQAGDPWDGGSPLESHLVTLEGGWIDFFGPVMQATGPVGIVDASQKLCRIRCPSDFQAPGQTDGDAFIQLTRWYESRFYKISQIRGRWIYFVADDLEKVSSLGYNVNYDLLYGRKNPRFRLCNVSGTAAGISSGKLRLPAGSGKVHCCKAATFLSIHGSNLGAIVLDGFQFLGNAAIGDCPLIGVYHCSCSEGFKLKDCRFSCLDSHLLSAEYADGISVSGNTFSHCRKHVISCSTTCRNVSVTDNVFDHCGCSLGPWACITACGDGYHITGNRIGNFGYVGIFIGTPERLLYGAEPGGIVEGNELWHDPDFAASCSEYTMMDSGGIYISTCNDRATVRKNFIHDISGMKDNRGIFCDDGARNFDLYDNVILRIANSYAIDARRVPEEEGSRLRNNVGNCVRDNLTDSPIRFEGNEEDDRCILGTNTLMPGKEGGRVPAVSTRNISRQAAQSTTETIQGTKWEATVR